MILGVSSTSTTQKWPFTPIASYARLVSITTYKTLKSKVCVIPNTFPNTAMLGTFPRFYVSYNFDWKSPISCYKLTVDASQAKMTPCYQIQDSRKDEKRDKGSRNYNYEQFQNNPRRRNTLINAPLPVTNTFNTPGGWKEEAGKLHKRKVEAEKLQKTKIEASPQYKIECLQDDMGVAEAKESKQSAFVNITNMLPVHDGLVISSETECSQHVVSNSLNPGSMNSKQNRLLEVAELDKINTQEQVPPAKSRAKYSSNPNHSAYASASTEPQVNGNKTEAMVHVNGQTLSDKKTNRSLPNLREKLASIYSNVIVVDKVSAAKKIVMKLTQDYRHHVHACDTEVAKIDLKQETPVDHGEVICFSIYSGPTADFGNGKSCIWVDLLNGGGRDLLKEFAPFFEDPSIRKVWHNYSFDNHVIENYGLKVSGFHADTMHMARLWDSSRRTDGGYSLEALTGDQRVMSEKGKTVYQRNESKDKIGDQEEDLMGKISMKMIFGKKKVKKDGSEGKMITIPPVEELQREERKLWICYSALDAISTLKLFESLKEKLSDRSWILDGKPVPGKSMLDFYQEYWQPFGEILVKMETEGMLVDRAYLAEIEKVAKAEQEGAVNRFRNWACKYCPDARYMNVGSDTQLRQLLFGGAQNSKDDSESLPDERIFKVPNTEGVIEKGKKTPTKFRNIRLCSIGVDLPIEKYTATGLPSVSGDTLKTLAGNISGQYNLVDGEHDPGSTEEQELSATDNSIVYEDAERSLPGANIKRFQSDEEAGEACHAIAALCEVCSIDSLISNFILPLQGTNVSGKNGRVHCSLNINTETGRLSARRPNLQNQPALEKDRYKIRQAFIAAPGNSLIVADYGQLELRILAHLSNCKSMLDAFKAGGDFHSRTAMNMYSHIRDAVERRQVLLEWHPQPGEDKHPVPLLKDAFACERRKAKMLNFSIAYGKTPVGLARDWKVSVEEAKKTVDLWYKERQEVLTWQEARKREARKDNCVHTLLGRARRFPNLNFATRSQKNHIERAAINTPVQGSAADVAMCAMLEISKNDRLKELGWKLLLQVHDEVILEGPTESAEVARAIVVECMSKPFNGKNILRVDLSVDAKCAQNWYSAK